MKKVIIYAGIILGSMLVTQSAIAQDELSSPETLDVTVRLLNKKGKPFKGAGTIVHIKGSEDFHGTSADGIVVIPGVNPDDTISILSSVAIFEIPVMGMDSINVIFQSNRKIQGYYSKDESEILDYGYLTVNRRADSGPTRSLDLSEAGNYTKLLEFLDGRLAGVEVNPAAGTIRIRGINSINSSTQPLIVVDGVPMDVGTANSLVVPKDIESITVDKQGTMYGVRGSNGVIIIKRKRGE